MHVSECITDSGTDTDDSGEAGNNNNNNNNNDAQVVPKIMVNCQPAFYIFFYCNFSWNCSQKFLGIFIGFFSLYFIYISLFDCLYEGGIVKIRTCGSFVGEGVEYTFFYKKQVFKNMRLK